MPLTRRHEGFARRATPGGADRFACVRWEPGRGGMPLLADALAVLECDIVAEHPAGDHWIVIGHAEQLRTSTSADPLVFLDGTFTALRGRGAPTHTRPRRPQAT